MNQQKYAHLCVDVILNKIKYLVLLLMLVGCTDRATQVHEAAKLLGNKQKICYTATSPDNIKGYYCLQYIHE